MPKGYIHTMLLTYILKTHPLPVIFNLIFCVKDIEPKPDPLQAENPNQHNCKIY